MSQVQPLSLGERYRVEQLLGQGGMGSVYRAFDRLTGQQVALKLVPVGEDFDEHKSGRSASLGDAATLALTLDGVAGDSGATQVAALTPSLLDKTVAAKMQSLRLQTTNSVRISVGPPKSSTNAMWARLALAQEFRTLASLRHPHIISVLDYGFVGRRQPYFTMELLQNAQTLSAAGKRLDRRAQVELLLQLLRALSYLHRRSILHRDLKPANVMVLGAGEGAQVKLLDFGLSLVRSHAQPKAGEISGTIAYMAPELFLDSRPRKLAIYLPSGLWRTSCFVATTRLRAKAMGCRSAQLPVASRHGMGCRISPRYRVFCGASCRRPRLCVQAPMRR